MPDPSPSNPSREPQPAAADSVAPSPSSPNLDADITDELADHLSLSARDLQLEGHTAAEANQIAQQKLGDIATIRRRLWWIHQGDELMLRTALAIVCAILVVAVAALGIGNRRMSRTIDDLHGTLTDLSENQKQLTDAQTTILETQRLNRPLTIHGRLYVRGPATPAPKAEVHLYREADRKLIDKYTADQNGQFVTAPLAPERYFVVAPLVGNNPAAQLDDRDYRPMFAVQSDLIRVSRQAVDPQIELNVGMIPLGQVSLEMTQKFLPPREREMDARDRHARFLFREGVPRQVSLVVAMYKQGNEIPKLQTEDANAPIRPLVPGFYTGRLLNVAEFSYRRDNRSTSVAGPFEPGKLYPLRRLLVSDNGTSRSLSETGSFRVAAYLTLSGFTATAKSSLKRPAEWDRAKALPAERFIEVEVKDARRTHLRLTPPREFDKEAQDLLDGIATEQDLVAALDRMWPVKVEFAGFEEMIKPSEWHKNVWENIPLK